MTPTPLSPRVLYVDNSLSGGSGESLFLLMQAREAKSRSQLLRYGTGGTISDGFRGLGIAPPPRSMYFRSWLSYRPRGTLLTRYPRFVGAVVTQAFSVARLVAVAKRHRLNVVHTNTIYLIEGALVAWGLGIPHVWQVRELIDLDYYTYQISKKRVVQTLNALSTVVLCNSQRTRKGLEDLGIESDRIRVLPNLVEVPPEQADLRQLLGLPQEVRLVGLAGWISPNKRVEDFIAMASRMADLGSSVRFVVLGGSSYGRRHYVDQIQTMVEHSANRESIIFTGHVERASRYFGSLNVLVCTCFTESFGRTVPEAMTLGTPVIGVRGTAVEEIITDGEAGFLIDKGDVDALETHVRTLLKDLDLGRRMGEAGREVTAARYRPEVLEGQYQGLYEEVLERGR